MTHPAIARPWSLITLGHMRQLGCLFLAAACLGAADDYDEPSRAGWGAFAVPANLAELAAHDLVPGQGLVVLFVRPDSTADSLGITAGDVILSLNDKAVSSRAEVRAVVRSAEAGDAVRAVVKRGDMVRERSGAFAERQPRPPGPPPWAWAGLAPGFAQLFDGRDASEQRRQLLAERDALALAGAELAAVPRPAPTPAWYVTVVVR